MGWGMVEIIEEVRPELSRDEDTSKPVQGAVLSRGRMFQIEVAYDLPRLPYGANREMLGGGSRWTGRALVCCVISGDH